MASLSFDEVSGVARVHFRYAGKQFQKSLKTDDRRKAESMKAQIEETLHDLERGRMELPAGADFWEFLKTGGKREQKVRLDDELNLEGLFAWYFAQVPEGGKEPKTLSTEHVHERHFLRILGKRRLLSTLTAEDFQKYINKRAGERRHKKPIGSETIGKEMKTLQMVWNRAVKMGRLGTKAPTDGLIYPKRKEKPPFQTWEEIERNIARGEPAREQWDSLSAS